MSSAACLDLPVVIKILPDNGMIAAGERGHVKGHRVDTLLAPLGSSAREVDVFFSPKHLAAPTEVVRGQNERHVPVVLATKHVHGPGKKREKSYWLWLKAHGL